MSPICVMNRMRGWICPPFSRCSLRWCLATLLPRNRHEILPVTPDAFGASHYRGLGPGLSQFGPLVPLIFAGDQEAGHDKCTWRQDRKQQLWVAL